VILVDKIELTSHIIELKLLEELGIKVTQSTLIVETSCWIQVSCPINDIVYRTINS